MRSGLPPLRPSDSESEFPAPPGDEGIAERASLLAACLLDEALRLQTSRGRRETAKLGRLLEDPSGRAFTFAMVDEVFRSRAPARSARRWRSLLDTFGLPEYLSLPDRLLMQLGALASRFLPGPVMKSVAHRMAKESARVIIPAAEGPLHRYLDSRRREGFRVNLNHLGEAVLGEEEAQRRLASALGYLADPAVNWISVKLSAIFSQIHLVAWRDTLTQIKSRLRLLYRAALREGKFVNLDMEEYRDLALTVTAFCEVLDEAEFHHLSAGLALQAYLPDSVAVQRELTGWAQRRVENGGAPVRVRLVKGANLAMELVEAELHGWHPAPYGSKAETDANFRRLLDYASHPDRARAVRIGVASHNLFDVALALVLRETRKIGPFLEIEMLEGMANHQARAVRGEAGSLLLYAPAVHRDDFMSAMAYLVRRLDENTAPDNFLRDMFAMRPGSAAWERQAHRFREGWEARSSVSSESRRARPAVDPEQGEAFVNEPDTDWTQSVNRAALKVSLQRRQPEPLPPLPDLETILQLAEASRPGWDALGIPRRAAILDRAASIMSAQRMETLACLQEDGKKSITEGDVEISEAIDFARYYARTAEVAEGATSTPLGIVAVVSPWNFPYAIPAGGILAALMAGNSVIFKPSRATARIARRLFIQLREAGVPSEVLHFFPCDGETGRALISDPRLAAVILTGSYETARLFQHWRPDLPLFAETSGKNAIVITAQADRDLAVKDLVRSAFGHSGQKCSAASLAILEAEVYDDPAFLRQLRDAAASLHAGPATDLRSVITPLVTDPGTDLRRGLTTLDEHEEWLLEPRLIDAPSNLWSPGIRLGVRPGSWFHRTECFGPVLGLMRATSLAEATTWQNATDYGLTAGLHSLDPAERAWWRDRVEAGNLYINRPVTGAVVQRQPFGGWKKSCIGPGAKAGGPNYVNAFRRFDDAAETPPDYAAARKAHFSIDHDPAALRCESNLFRYRPSRGIILRLEKRDEVTLARAKLASEVSEVPLEIRIGDEESDADFISRLPGLAAHAEFLRTITPPSPEVLRAAHELGLNWIDAPVLACGRLELLRWFREQSVSETLHRYGQVSATSAARPPG